MYLSSRSLLAVSSKIFRLARLQISEIQVPSGGMFWLASDRTFTHCRFCCIVKRVLSPYSGSTLSYLLAFDSFRHISISFSNILVLEELLKFFMCNKFILHRIFTFPEFDSSIGRQDELVSMFLFEGVDSAKQSFAI